MSRLSDKQISQLVEDIRKINSPAICDGQGELAASRLLGHNSVINKMKSAPKGFIRKAEAAQVLGCTIRTVDNWMRAKLIPHYKLGRSVFFKESDLLGAIEKGKVS